MKRTAIDHPKMLLLEAELRAVLPADAQPFAGSIAVGIVETLFHWCPKYAIRGDVGKWPDAVIGAGLGWPGRGEELVNALVAARWIDRVEGETRLALHDVADHADNTWRQCLEDANLTFWDNSPPRKQLRNKGVTRVTKKTPVKLQKTSSKPPEKLHSHSHSHSRSLNPPTPPAGGMDSDPADRIDRLVKMWPTSAGIERGRRAIGEKLAESVNPEKTLIAMEANLPRWADLYRGREPQYRKSLANAMRDDDWMHPPTTPGQSGGGYIDVAEVLAREERR